MKQKKSRFVLIWLLICLVLLAASFIVPGREKGETIQTAMRDAVLHDVNQIDFLGLRPVNPGFISAFVVMAVLLVTALCIRIFVIPRFKYVPGKFQLVLEQLVGMFDDLAKTNSPWRNSFLGAYAVEGKVWLFYHDIRRAEVIRPGLKKQGGIQMGVETTTLTVNGVKRVFSMGDAFGQVPYSETLLETLRDRLGLTGAKRACDEGACGCCTVIKNGDAVPSCMLLTADCDGAEITTLEGLADPETGELSKVQQAFLDYNAFQCGFCTPGIIMTATALLDKNPNPSEEEVRDALSGNYCRCISQYHVFEAIASVAGRGVELDEKWEGRR